MKEIITDAKTRCVCFSSLITRFKLWEKLEAILKEKNIFYNFINNTKDIWVRDFMPIEVSYGHFLKFGYNPSYLRTLPEYRTDWPNRSKIYLRREGENKHRSTGFSFPGAHLDINLDGGNVIKCDDCIIISDRMFRENRRMKRAVLLDALEDAFGQEVVIIPSDPEEKTGHADGMLRYIGSNTVLLNHYVDFDKELRDKLLKALSHRFSVAELHYGTNACSGTNWAYLNYLQVGEHIIVPALNHTLDDIAFRQLEDILKTDIDVVPAYGVVRIGGGLNCLSWTTKGIVMDVQYDDLVLPI